jgi:hypothetical protein
MPTRRRRNMKRQLVRGTTMLLVVMALAFVTAVANGQSLRAVADVPFEFVAGNRTLPAGHYNLSDATNGREVVKISGREKNATIFAMTVPLSRGNAADRGKLVFRRYGNRYFLAEIWTGGEREGQKLRKSKEEKAIENEMAIISSKTDLAQRSYEVVEIALARQ